MISISRILSLRGHKFSVLLLQTLVFFGASISVVLLNETNLEQTIFLLFVVLFSGTYFCFQLVKKIEDSNLVFLPYLWIIKFCITIFLLYFGWVKDLDPSSPYWGGDAARYYQDSWNLISNQWIPVVGSNYQGVIFYYAFVFFILGHNPIIPALINIFVTLIAFIYLIQTIYRILPRKKNDWLIVFILLIPEVLWFDVMTSRETLMGALIIFCIFPTLNYIYGNSSVSTIRFLITILLPMILILVVRTSVIIPVIICMLVYFLFLYGKTNRKISFLKILILFLVTFIIILGPILQEQTGGYAINYLDILNQLQSFDDNVAAGMEWSNKSIGLLLAPKSTFQSILFLPPRVLLYILAPLPNFSTDLTQLFYGSSTAWSWLMSALTSLIVILLFPYSLAGLTTAWKFRKIDKVTLAIHITFWIFIMSIAGGNIIIVERYRIMITMITFLTIWLGYTRADSKSIKRMSLIWFVGLFSGIIFYISYKYI
jgi:hypothetical protein